MFKLCYVLFKIRLFSPWGLYRFLSAIFRYGINVMALLYFAAKSYADKIALVDAYESLTYRQLLAQAAKLSSVLRENYSIKSGHKIAFLCKNHGSLVKSIFAVSQLGADVYLLNAEMSREQLNSLLECHNFSLLIYDFELDPLVKSSHYGQNTILSYHTHLPAINNLLQTSTGEPLEVQRSSRGKIVMLTGGTTGNFKVAAHKPSVLNFLNPFLALLTRLKLLNYHTAYIATPIYHGYGVAILFLFMALGKKIIINNGFDAGKACSLIREHKVEVVTVVPLMIYKMLKVNIEDLRSLTCIVSGGAELSPRLAEEVFCKLGDVLYNLYGTSEAGLNTIAMPQDLKCAPNTIGKIIKGVQLRILDENKQEVEIGKTGQFCIKNKWSMKNSTTSWIETGDLGYRDEQGHYFLCGRIDDMVVSGGENVYPVEVEQILKLHPQVEDAAVIGIRDEVFGHRLKAFVLPVEKAVVTGEELMDWLRARVARFQLPKEIIFVEHMPYTPLGKLDKKQLI